MNAPLPSREHSGAGQVAFRKTLYESLESPWSFFPRQSTLPVEEPMTLCHHSWDGDHWSPLTLRRFTTFTDLVRAFEANASWLEAAGQEGNGTWRPWGSFR